MSKDGSVCLLMILNVNTYANVILKRSLRANEGHIGVNESIMTVMKHVLHSVCWATLPTKVFIYDSHCRLLTSFFFCLVYKSFETV